MFVLVEDFAGYRLYSRLRNVSAYPAAHLTRSLLRLGSRLADLLLRLAFRVASDIAGFIFQLGASFLAGGGRKHQRECHSDSKTQCESHRVPLSHLDVSAEANVGLRQGIVVSIDQSLSPPGLVRASGHARKGAARLDL